MMLSGVKSIFVLLPSSTPSSPSCRGTDKGISYLYMESGPRALTLSRDLSPFCRYRASLALCSAVMFALVPSLEAQRVNEFSSWLNLLIKVLQFADRPVSVSFSQ